MLILTQLYKDTKNTLNKKFKDVYYFKNFFHNNMHLNHQ